MWLFRRRGSKQGKDAAPKNGGAAPNAVRGAEPRRQTLPPSYKERQAKAGSAGRTARASTEDAAAQPKQTRSHTIGPTYNRYKARSRKNGIAVEAFERWYQDVSAKPKDNEVLYVNEQKAPRLSEAMPEFRQVLNQVYLKYIIDLDTPFSEKALRRFLKRCQPTRTYKEISERARLIVQQFGNGKELSYDQFIKWYDEAVIKAPEVVAQDLKRNGIIFSPPSTEQQHAGHQALQAEQQAGQHSSANSAAGSVNGSVRRGSAGGSVAGRAARKKRPSLSQEWDEFRDALKELFDMYIPEVKDVMAEPKLCGLDVWHFLVKCQSRVSRLNKKAVYKEDAVFARRASEILHTYGDDESLTFEQFSRWYDEAVLTTPEAVVRDFKRHNIDLSVPGRSRSRSASNASQQSAPPPAVTKKAAKVLKVGSRVSVLSRTGKWRTCVIIETRADEVYVHYEGYRDKYDEWVPQNSDRIAFLADHDNMSVSSMGSQRGTRQSARAKSANPPMTRDNQQRRPMAQRSQSQTRAESRERPSGLYGRSKIGVTRSSRSRSLPKEDERPPFRTRYGGSTAKGTSVERRRRYINT